MTSNNGGGSFAGHGGDRSRLVVPKLHQSMWATSNADRGVNQVRQQTTPAPVRLDTANLGAKVRLQPKSYAGPRRSMPTASASLGVISRSGRTIQPLNGQINQGGAQVNQNSQPVAQQQASADGFMPTIPQYSPDAIPAKRAQIKSSVKLGQSVSSVQPTQTAQPAQQPNIDREAILRRAAQVREQARLQAEARAKADAAKAQLVARVKQQQLAKAANPTSVMMRSTDRNSSANVSAQSNFAHNAFAPASVNPVMNSQPAVQATTSATATNNASADQQPFNLAEAGIDQTGAAAIPQSNNLFQRLAGAKVTFSFKINKQRLCAVLRYLAVAIIILASGYLAWDTYMTNQSVKNSFGGSSAASAMSIAGTNPATADQTAISQEDKAAYTVPADQPRYIYIPAIGVNARVMSVGVNSSGNIDTPTNLNDTAWYDGSAKPGQEGQVFIDGHTSFSTTINAAFNNLPKLKAGDLITIEKGNGEKINYRVTETETVEASAVDMGKALNAPEGAKRGLTLMTCTGTFNYRTQTADKRLIVYAVQE